DHGDKAKISIIPTNPELVDATWAKALLEKTNYSNCELLLPAKVADLKNPRLTLTSATSVEQLIE
ncbi:hypothetical protein, partial [Enterococcus cecorum]